MHEHEHKHHHAHTVAEHKNVCADFNGVHSSQVVLENHNSNDVLVKYYNGDPSTWPFPNESSPFSVPAKVGSNPGTKTVVLAAKNGKYHYATDGCHNKTGDTNPKTVIIT